MINNGVRRFGLFNTRPTHTLVWLASYHHDPATIFPSRNVVAAWSDLIPPWPP